MDQDIHNCEVDAGYPVNPPGAFLTKGDVMMTEYELANWEGEGGPEYRPRLRDQVQTVKMTGFRMVPDGEASELDEETDGWDCD